MSDLKKIACDAIEAAADDLHSLSDDIWAHPELALNETHAHQVLTSFLDQHGFQVDRSYHLDTAFRATYGPETRPNVCVISEYDALPEIGHACGHNLIAEVGVAAGIGIMAAMKASNKKLGKLTVLGTPAEEGYAAKIDLVDAGAFKNVDMAMTAHPFPDNDSTPIMLARESLEITYVGKASHAAGFPWEGLNALDAAVSCYNNLSCLRQQIKPDWRIHCMFKEGGVKVNIIPERTVIEVTIRTPTDKEIAILKKKIVACCEAAALATGCEMSYKTSERFCSSLLHNGPLVAQYEANFAEFITDDVPHKRSNVCGSTDMGAVAHVVPSIHPHYYIGGVEVNHTIGFTGDAGHPRAQKYVLIQAKALAMTAIDVMLNPDLLRSVQEAFMRDLDNA